MESPHLNDFIYFLLSHFDKTAILLEYSPYICAIWRNYMFDLNVFFFLLFMNIIIIVTEFA